MKSYEILQIIEEEDVEFIRLQYVDMFGNLKNIAVTPGQMERVFNNEYYFAGDALFDGLYENEEEYYLYPDLDSFVILPWRPQQGRVARIICDIGDSEGNLLALSPRTILKKTIDDCKKLGYDSIVNAECEFFLFHTDDNDMPTVISHEKAGYMDVGPADLGENARRDMVLNLEAMGFEIESSHHEESPAQHGIDFRQGETLKTADALTSFKFAVRSIAKRFGLCATFMPKPCKECKGSGMALNFALTKDGVNIFEKEDKTEAKYFIGGLLKYASQMSAVVNPTVNSYKRLIANFDGPIGWSTKGDKSIVKLRKTFGQTKVDFRLPDSSANQYLALAVSLAAGIRGIEEKIDPDALLNNLDDCQKRLPDNLNEAIDVMKNSQFIKDVLGEEFINIYTTVKENEWSDYMHTVSDWEVDRYLSKI